MKRYRNLSGVSGVGAYGTGPDFIDVEFRGGACYRYSHRSAGQDKVEEGSHAALLRGNGHYARLYNLAVSSDADGSQEGLFQ